MSNSPSPQTEVKSLSNKTLPLRPQLVLKTALCCLEIPNRPVSFLAPLVARLSLADTDLALAK